MTRTGATAVALAALLALGACGSAADSALARAVKSLSGSLKPGQNGGAAAVNPAEVLTREMLAGVHEPVLLAEVEARGTAATLSQVARNGNYISWMSGDGVGLNFLGDLLSSTRGLGADLMASDLTGVARALAQPGGSEVVRVHHLLDGQGHDVVQSFTCNYAETGRETIEIIGARHATRHVVERCAGAAGKFENHYWIGTADGAIWKSRQWVSAAVGSVILQHLVRIGA